MESSILRDVETHRDCFYQDIAGLTKENINDIKVKYLGRNGIIQELLKKIAEIPKEEKPLFGKAVNELKNEISNRVSQLLSEDSASKQEKLDFTLPGRNYKRGNLHPLTKTMNEICSLFERLGFSIAEGPEVETDYYNFTALNIPENHPARDMHDTFYFNPVHILRTHTSPVQIRVMEQGTPPFRFLAPGKVYRRDSDVTHSPMFHQIEGFYVDLGVNWGHLKSVLTSFIKQLFGESRKIRLRPSFFPFTEPSAEVDISCGICEGKGCRLCSNTGWLEILGAGMIDPQVLKNVGIDPEKYSGYAFGMGVERIAILKYGINDIRLFFENHLAFLNQFYAL